MSLVLNYLMFNNYIFFFVGYHKSYFLSHGDHCHIHTFEAYVPQLIHKCTS